MLAYDRAGNGGLTYLGSFPTRGNGSGAGLNSQGAVIVSDNSRFVFAVNAGSNSISSFRVLPKGLELADVVASGEWAVTAIHAREAAPQGLPPGFRAS